MSAGINTIKTHLDGLKKSIDSFCMDNTDVFEFEIIDDTLYFTLDDDIDGIRWIIERTM